MELPNVRSSAISAIIGFVILGCVAAPLAQSSCGDGIIEPEHYAELCDDGPANGSDGCCRADCTPFDVDGDGLCDAFDPCPSPGPYLADATLLIRGFTTAPGDDRFRLSGTFAPTTTVDPAASGVTIGVSNVYRGALVRARIEGGAGWRIGNQGEWIFRDPTGAHDGITSVTIKPVGDGKLAVMIKGRRSDYARIADIRPVRAAIAFTASADTTGRCAEVLLSNLRCKFASSGDALRCPRRVLPRKCTSSRPDARVLCDAQNGAAGQEAYFELHGRYASGDCTGLPGFVPSPDVVCVTTGNDTIFSLTTSSPFGMRVCYYTSDPALGTPNLVCQ